MAFVTPIPEEQQNQLGPSGQTTPNPMAMLPPQAGGSSGQAGAGAAGAPSVGTPTKFGSTASRLGDYLKANKDQVQQMANQVSGQLGSRYSGVQQGVNQAATEFGGQVSAGYTPPDPTLLQEVRDNPAGVAGDAGKVQSFQKQLNNAYSGPTSFEASNPYATAQKSVQEAMQQAQLLGTYPGLSQYLQSNVERNATPGQNTLDTVLLQSSMPAYESVKAAAQPFGGLGDYLKDVTAQQNQGVQQAVQAAQGTRGAAQQALSDATAPLISGMNTGYQQGVQKAQDYNTGLNTIAQKIANQNFNSLTPEERTMIGFNPSLIGLMQEYPNIFPTQAGQNPINWANYFFQGPQATTPGPENTVTPEQLANYRALTTLSGTAPTGLNFALPTEAGTPFALPGQGPTYNNMGAASEIAGNYGPMYQQLLNTGYAGSNKQKIDDYMQQLYGFMGQEMPAPQPAEPPGYVPPPEAPPPIGGENPPPVAPYPNPTSPNPYGDSGIWDPWGGVWFQRGHV